MKKAISLLMAGGMMMSLAACGGSAAASSDNAANTTTSTETASTAADSGEKITLHCMMSARQDGWSRNADLVTVRWQSAEGHDWTCASDQS